VLESPGHSAHPGDPLLSQDGISGPEIRGQLTVPANPLLFYQEARGIYGKYINPVPLGS